MYYKSDIQNNIWHKGNLIHLPSGEILENGTPSSSDGWVWSEEEPQEYAEWAEKQRLEELRILIEEQILESE